MRQRSGTRSLDDRQRTDWAWGEPPLCRRVQRARLGDVRGGCQDLSAASGPSVELPLVLTELDIDIVHRVTEVVADSADLIEAGLLRSAGDLREEADRIASHVLEALEKLDITWGSSGSLVFLFERADHLDISGINAKLTNGMAALPAPLADLGFYNMDELVEAMRRRRGADAPLMRRGT